MSLFAELKRRKVVRVAVVYAATAFAIVQAADVMLPRLGVPDWALTLIVVLVVLGFPAALVLAWALELTPEGVKVTRPPDAQAGVEPPPSLLGKRTVFAAALLVVLGVGIGAGWFLRPVSGPDAALAEKPAEGQAAEPAAERSIAVLPFADMSPDKDQEYFSDGLSEEILNLLAQIRDLRVIGRTSSFAFKGRNEDLRTIGSTLGVAYLLEGSVRKAGDDLRITAQLIQADDGSHLWSQSYDRRLENVFAIQTEIAGAIAEALRVSLSGPGRAGPAARAAASLPAYDLFLQARRLIQGRTRDGLEAARELLDEALALDPDYAPALAEAAQAVLFLNNDLWVQGYGDIPLDEAVALAQPLLDRALALEPNLAEAHAVQGLLFHTQRDSTRAEAALARALALNPSLADALHWRARLLDDAGRLREQLAIRHRLAEIDPLHVGNLFALPWNLLDSGEFAEAEAMAVRLQRAFPDYPQGFAAQADVLLSAGRLAEARVPAAQALRLAPDYAFAKAVHGWLYYLLGDFDRALSLLGARDRGPALIALGRIDEAVATAREHLAEAPADQDAAVPLLSTLSVAGRHDEVLALYHERWGDLEGLDAYFGTGGAGLPAPIAAAQHALGQHEALAETLAHWRERLAFLREQGHAGREFRITEARYLALAGEYAAASAALTEAIALGFRDPLLGRDPAFAELREDPAFEAQVGRNIDLINVERAKLSMEPL